MLLAVDGVTSIKDERLADQLLRSDGCYYTSYVCLGTLKLARRCLTQVSDMVVVFLSIIHE